MTGYQDPIKGDWPFKSLMTWHTLFSRYASPTSRQAGKDGLQALVIDGMRAAAQTMEGLDDATIRQRVDLLVSEMREEGINTSFVNFGQFLQFAVPRHQMFSQLYQKVSLAEWANKMVEKNNEKNTDMDTWSPSLRVRVWVGGGKGRGAAGERITIGEAVGVLKPASEDSRNAVFKADTQCKWLAFCSRIAIDATAVMLKGGSLASLPTIISAKTKDPVISQGDTTADKVPLLDGADHGSASFKKFKISQEGSATRFVSSNGPVLLISDRAASSGAPLRWRFKATKNVFGISVIVDGTNPIIVDGTELRVGLASGGSGMSLCGGSGMSLLTQVLMNDKWVDVVCDIERMTVVFNIEGSSPIEQSLEKLTPMGLARFAGGGFGAASTPATGGGFGPNFGQPLTPLKLRLALCTWDGTGVCNV